jgi:hypothetical protein
MGTHTHIHSPHARSSERTNERTKGQARQPAQNQTGRRRVCLLCIESRSDWRYTYTYLYLWSFQTNVSVPNQAHRPAPLVYLLFHSFLIRSHSAHTFCINCVFVPSFLRNSKSKCFSGGFEAEV